MAEVEEPQFTNLQERIAALNKQKNFQAPACWQTSPAASLHRTDQAQLRKFPTRERLSAMMAFLTRALRCHQDRPEQVLIKRLLRCLEEQRSPRMKGSPSTIAESQSSPASSW